MVFEAFVQDIFLYYSTPYLLCNEQAEFQILVCIYKQIVNSMSPVQLATNPVDLDLQRFQNRIYLG